MVRALTVELVDGGGGKTPLHQLVIDDFLCVVGDSPRDGRARRDDRDLPDGDRRLAVGTELRPVTCDRGVVGDQSAIDQAVDDRGGNALGCREDEGSGVACPALSGRRRTRPDIQGGLAVHIDAQAAAAQPVFGEHPFEGAHDGGQLGPRPAFHSVGQP